MIKVRKFQLKDLELMDLKDHEAELLGEGNLFIDKLRDADKALTILNNGKIVCCIGVNETLAWLIPSVHIDENSLAIARTIKRICKEYKFLKTVCLDNMFYFRWMTFLNFNPVCYFKHNGESFCLYERSV